MDDEFFLQSIYCIYSDACVPIKKFHFETIISERAGILNCC